MKINGYPVKLSHVLTGLTLVGAIIGYTLTIDSRYAHSADLKRTISEVYIDTQQSQTELELQLTEQSLLDIEMRRQAELSFPTDAHRKEQLQKRMERLLERKDELSDQEVRLKGGS